MTNRQIDNRSLRLRICISIVILIPIGFYSKLYHGPGQTWIHYSFGGIVYEIFWILAAAFIWKYKHPFKIALWVFLITCSLEILQLWDTPILGYIRSTFIGRTLLGTTFSLLDFPCYFLGSILGWAWILLLSKRPITEQEP